MLSVLAIGLMILSFKYLMAQAGSFFFLFAFIIFMALSLVLVSEIPVEFVTSTTDGSTTWTETKCVICEGGYILGFIFFAFGLFSVGMMVWKHFGGKEEGY